MTRTRLARHVVVFSLAALVLCIGVPGLVLKMVREGVKR
jgi:hypothetical protein